MTAEEGTWRASSFRPVRTSTSTDIPRRSGREEESGLTSIVLARDTSLETSMVGLTSETTPAPAPPRSGPRGGARPCRPPGEGFDLPVDRANAHLSDVPHPRVLPRVCEPG